MNDYDDVEVSALTHKVICSPLRTRVAVGNHAHLRGLTLADSRIGRSSKIDVLIGADRYYDFIQWRLVNRALWAMPPQGKCRNKISS